MWINPKTSRPSKKRSYFSTIIQRPRTSKWWCSKDIMSRKRWASRIIRARIMHKISALSLRFRSQPIPARKILSLRKDCTKIPHQSWAWSSSRSWQWRMKECCSAMIQSTRPRLQPVHIKRAVLCCHHHRFRHCSRRRRWHRTQMISKFSFRTILLHTSQTTLSKSTKRQKL